MKNAEAERTLKNTNGIRITRDNRLQCIDANIQCLLDNAIRSVCDEYGKRSTSQRIIVYPDREENESSILMEVSPLYEIHRSNESHLKNAMILFIEISKCRNISINRVEIAFGLTSAEADICRLLVEGKTTQEIANERRVSPETIKSQVKSVLSKTQCKKRSELIRLVSAISSPISTI